MGGLKCVRKRSDRIKSEIPAQWAAPGAAQRCDATAEKQRVRFSGFYSCLEMLGMFLGSAVSTRDSLPNLANRNQLLKFC